MRLDELIGPDRATRLRTVLHRQLVDAYSENCERFNEAIGDNNVTFGVTVVHNLRHRVEEALVGEPGFRTARPRGSFEIVIDGLVSLHLYKAKRGEHGPEMIRLDDSQTKIALVARNQNPDQLSLDLDDSASEVMRNGVRQLLLLHVGDPDDGFEIAYIGAPAYSPVLGFQWLWLESLDGSEEIERIDIAPPTPDTEMVFGSGKLPELDVELLHDVAEERRDQEAG